MSLGLSSALTALSKAALEEARHNAALRKAVRNQSAKRANVKARAPSPPKPKARTPSPPKPKARTPSPPKARSAPRSTAVGPRRFRSPNQTAYQRLSPRSKRTAYLAPTRFIQNLMNEEDRLMKRHYLKYSNNLNENRRLRNANLRRVREIQHIIGSLYTRSRSPTRARRNPFLKKSPRSQRRSPARGRILAAIREAQ
jgi:hypothetical protein